MPSNFTKQPQFPLQPFLNSGTGDLASQGVLTGVPAGIVASQGAQNLPGDRIVLGARDAYALSNLTVGTLYSGIYMRVGMNPTAGSAILGRLAFWDPAAFSTAATNAINFDNLYQVTPAELQSGVGRTGPIAGVFINALVQASWWWIQIAGKATVAFGAATGSYFGGTSTYAINSGVFAGGYGTTTGSGLATSVNGQIVAAALTSTNVGDMMAMFLGVSESLPAASTSSIVDLKLNLYRL